MGRQRLLIEIDADREPISGLVRRLQSGDQAEPEERARRFTGYMELIAALERVTSVGSDDRRGPHGGGGAAP